MDQGHQLIKDQLFFRKELMERIDWFILLRWIAVALGLTGTWTAYFIGYPIAIWPISAILLFCSFYNALFFFTWRRYRLFRAGDIEYYIIFAHIQVSLDFFSLFAIIFFTGGFFSPILLFIFFHILLTGILLSPASCYAYAVVVLAAMAMMILLHITQILPPRPSLFQHITMPSSESLFDILSLYAIFSVTILVTAYLITSLKVSLRTKGRELLRVSKELDTSIIKLKALYGMVKEMHTCTDLRALTDSATKNAAIIMGVKACSIKLLDDQRRKLDFVSAYGLSEDYTKKGPIDIGKSPVNLRIVKGDRFSIGCIDEKEAFQYPEDIEKESISSLICLPLRVEKMIIGVFCIYSATPSFFSSEDVDFFSLMADLTAIGIENIRNQENKAWFVKKASHQLRAPLNAAFSMLDLLEKEYHGPVGPRQKEILLRCKARIQLLGEMVGDLLKIGIKRANMKMSTRFEVNVKKKLREVATFYEARAAGKNIRFQLQIDESVPTIQTDPQILDHIFSNLISNAIKYTPDGGSVSVQLSMDNKKYIVFDIADTGIGIPDSDLSNIFTEFYRSENAKECTEQGTGLGLVIVKEALDGLNGSITVESRIGKGARFISRFPVPV